MTLPVVIYTITLILIGSLVIALMSLSQSRMARMVYQKVSLKRTAAGLQRIPRIIHRTSKTLKLSPGHQYAWDLTARHNPGYKQILYDDDMARELIRKNFDKSVVAVFDRLVDGAAKADLFRYCVMYVKGGVYLDIKSAAHDLSDLIRPDDRFVVSAWPWWAAMYQTNCRGFWDFGEIQQWWIAAEPNHPAFMHTINAVIKGVQSRLDTNTLTKRTHSAITKNMSSDRNIKKMVMKNNYSFETLNSSGPWIYTANVIALHGDDRPRVTLPNGNGVLSYAACYHHPGKSYSAAGPFIKAMLQRIFRSHA